MLYFHKRDRGCILSCEVLDLSYLLNGYQKPVYIEDWDKEVPDTSDVLGEVLITPYNENTIGVVENGDPSLRSRVIITILNSIGYDVAGLPNESWTRDRVIEFMGLSEEELSEFYIHLPERKRIKIKRDRVIRT